MGWKIDFRTGAEKQEIIFPCKQIPSSAWGGKHLDELYATSASYTLFGPQSDLAGRLFVVRGLEERGESLRLDVKNLFRFLHCIVLYI